MAFQNIHVCGAFFMISHALNNTVTDSQTVKKIEKLYINIPTTLRITNKNIHNLAFSDLRFSPPVTDPGTIQING